jgi:hypothetical protein
MAFFRLEIIATFAASKPLLKMKRLLFTIVFIFIGIFTVHAQWYIGGSVNAAINKESQAFSIAPDVGYSFTNAPLSIACALEYGGEFSKDNGYTHSLTVSPYFRYEICDIGERFSLFLDLCSDIDALELSYFDIGLSPGISFDLTEHWSAEFSLGLLEYKWEKVPDDKPTHNIEFGFKTAAPSFGIYYSF